MGCCESGDRHSETRFLPNYREKRFSRSKSAAPFQSHWQHFTQVRDQKDIPGLVDFIRAPERALISLPQTSEWIPPVSIGGHAISALAELCRTRGPEVAQALSNDLHEVVQNLCASPDLQDCSLVLLFYLSPALNSPLLDRLVNVNVYEGLCGVMKIGSKLRRQTAAETARIVYEGSEERKRAFIRCDGIPVLLHVLNMDRDEKDYIHNSLVRLYDLLLVTSTQDDQNQLIPSHRGALLEARVLESVSTLDVAGLSGATVELLDKLTWLLQCDSWSVSEDS